MFKNISDTKRMIDVANSLNPRWFSRIEHYIDDIDKKAYTIVEMNYIKYCFIHDYRSTKEEIKQLHDLLRRLVNEAKRLPRKNS